MTDVYVQCRLPAGHATRGGADDSNAATCLVLHRVQWLSTIESSNSDSVLCHFRAPDAESVRSVLRRLDIDVGGLWIDSSLAAIR